MEDDFAQFDTSCRDASRELEHLSVWQTAQQKALKSRFNVFTAVLKHDDEVRLHTRWLHYLLNREAEHDCDTLFLDLFIKTLEQVGVQPHEDNADATRLDKLKTFDCKTAWAKKELPTTHGNLDIYIESQKWGVIVIENKTKSGEGDNQIHNYAEYCTQHCFGPNCILLFLTPDGRQAETAGEHNGGYYRISYRDHILPWLEECLRKTYQYVHINQALQQYKNVVKQLLKRSSDDAYMNDVTEILKKNPAIIEHLDHINQAVDELRKNYWGNFVPELRIQLGRRGITLGQEKIYSRFHDFELETANFQRNGYPELKTTLEYWEKENCLFIGESVCPPDPKQRREYQQKKVKFEPFIERLSNEFPKDYARAEADQVWPLGWAKFLQEFMTPKFLARNSTQQSPPISEQVAYVVKDISRYLKVLEENWPKADA